jgi:hypothetical protein
MFENTSERKERSSNLAVLLVSVVNVLILGSL